MSASSASDPIGEKELVVVIGAVAGERGGDRRARVRAGVKPSSTGAVCSMFVATGSAGAEVRGWGTCWWGWAGALAAGLGAAGAGLGLGAVVLRKFWPGGGKLAM